MSYFRPLKILGEQEIIEALGHNSLTPKQMEEAMTIAEKQRNKDFREVMADFGEAASQFCRENGWTEPS